MESLRFSTNFVNEHRYGIITPREKAHLFTDHAQMEVIFQTCLRGMFFGVLDICYPSLSLLARAVYRHLKQVGQTLYLMAFVWVFQAYIIQGIEITEAGSQSDDGDYLRKLKF
jgi:hypothetical protein